MQKIYKGKIIEMANYDDVPYAIFLLNTAKLWWPLAEEVEEHSDKYGKQVTVHYAISDTPINEDALPTMMVIQGRCQADFQAYYDEMPDENGELEKVVDGSNQQVDIIDESGCRHELIDELQMNIGKYLYMTIDFGKEE